MKKLTLECERTKPRTPPNHEGFELDKPYISALSKKMTKVNASTLKLYFTNCANVYDRDVLFAIIDEKKLTLLQKIVLYLFKRVM